MTPAPRFVKIKVMLSLAGVLVCRWQSKSLVALVIGALCFSMGEGLRLAPFAVTAGAASTAVVETTTEAAGNPASTHSGPLAIPVSLQKRGKTPLPDVAGSAARNTLSQIASYLQLPVIAPVTPNSAWTASRPPGRAPPLFS